MLGAAVLLQLTLWVATIDAFYIWNYTDQCGIPGCSNSRRGINGKYAAAEPEGVTFDLYHRAPDSSEDVAKRSARVARVAGRLARKYTPLEIFRATRRHPELIGRENKYAVVEPATPTASNSAGIYHDGSDYSYFIQAKIGASQTPLYMLLDSGAGTTWVMGSTCESAPCKKHDTFAVKDSKTFEPDTKPFSISYGTGRVSGQLGRDTISAAGMTVAMTFGVASETSDDFNHFPFDGILGLSMSKGVSDNFMGVLVDKKALSSRIFSVSLGRYSDGSNHGQVTFGGTDPAKYTGNIKYTAVSAKGHGDWTIPMDDLGYDGKSSEIKGRLAYIDTGTSYVFGPGADVAALHKMIPGSTTTDQIEYTVPCDSKGLTVTFSGITYTISTKDWLSKSGDRCISNIYGHEVVQNSWLLGDLFLKNVYSVFDADEKRIGFAAKVASPDGPATVITTQPSTSGSNGPQTTPLTSPIAPSPGNTDPASPGGLNGQETGATAETATKPAATATQANPGEQLESNAYVSMLCIVAVIAMVA